MAMPQQQQQQQQFQQQSQHSKPFRNMFTIDNQIPSQIAFYNSATFADQSHPPYIPPFHVAGFAPGPISVTDGGGGGGGGDQQWMMNGSEPKKRRLKEEDFLDQNSSLQIPSVDFLQRRPVSTGLGLSLHDRRMASFGESHVLSLFDVEIDQELQRQDAEMDRLIKAQGEQLRQTILKKVQANQLQALSVVEERILQKLRQKEAEVEDINKKNAELEEQMKQLTIEVGAWQHRTKCNENMINALKVNLQHALAMGKDSKEGCGDSEVDDTASCCNGGPTDFHLARKENKELMTCKVCRVNEVCILLLPCRHLCLCKDCETKLSFCPLCQSSKYIGIEVYM